MFDNIVHSILQIIIDYYKIITKKMNEKIIMDKLYSENLKLGNRINDLNG